MAKSLVLRVSSALTVLGLGIITVWQLLGEALTGYVAGDLLINYSGGFVRRGLIGTFLSWSDYPLETARVVQILCVFLFFFGVSVAVFQERDERVMLGGVAFILFTPGGLFDMASSGDFEYLGRKEIWSYVSTLLIVFAVQFGLHSRRFLGALTFLSVLMTLNHELHFLFFFLPTLAVLYITHDGDLREKLLILSSVSALPALAFLLAVTNSGTPSQREAIYESYLSTDAEGIEGGIETLAWTFWESNALTLILLNDGDIRYWLFFLVCLLVLAFLLFGTVPKNAPHSKAFLAVLCVLSIAVVFAAIAGWDWGRWLSMGGIALFLHHLLIRRIVIPENRPLTPAEGHGSSQPARSLRSLATLASLALGFCLSVFTQMSHYGPRQLDDLWDPRLPPTLYEALQALPLL